MRWYVRLAMLVGLLWSGPGFAVPALPVMPGYKHTVFTIEDEGGARRRNGDDVFTHAHPFNPNDWMDAIVRYKYGWSPGGMNYIYSRGVIGVMIEADGIYYYDGRRR